MKPARNLPALLTRHEVQRFLSNLYPPRKPQKMMDLFRELRAHGKKPLLVMDKKEMGKRIYASVSARSKEKDKNGMRSKSFDMLQHRLQKKIIDFFTCDGFLNNHPVLEKLHSAQVEIKKKWVQYYILKYTGRTGTLADSMLDEAIAIAKKYQCYADLVQLLQSKRLDRGYRFGEQEINKLTAEIKQYEKYDRAVRRTHELYYRIIILKKFHINPDMKQLLKYENKILSELNRQYKKTNSAEILYFIRYIEIDFYQNQQEYDKAWESCIHILKILEDKPSVFTRPREDYALGNLGQIYICKGQYQNAFDTFENLKYIIHQPRDWAESKEMQLRSLFYMKKYKEAKHLLDVIYKNLPEDAEPIRLGRLIFYEACIQFMKGNFKNTKTIIEKKLFIQKDKTGWGISLRMLELMLLTEQHKKNECLRNVKRLKKFLARKNAVVSKRDLLMTDIFSFLAEKDFNTRETRKQILKARETLSIKKGEYAWDPLAHELIRYDEWLKIYI